MFYTSRKYGCKNSKNYYINIVEYLLKKKLFCLVPVNHPPPFHQSHQIIQLKNCEIWFRELTMKINNMRFLSILVECITYSF